MASDEKANLGALARAAAGNLAILIAVLSILAVVLSVAEDDVPLAKAPYYALITLSTVGYGDWVPTTALGRGVVVTSSLLLFAFFSFATEHLTQGLLTIYRQRTEARWKAVLPASMADGAPLALVLSASLVASLVGVGGLLLWAEGLGERSFGQGFYFAWITLTTLGFGDDVPLSLLGTAIVFLIVLIGCGLVSFFLYAMYETVAARVPVAYRSSGVAAMGLAAGFVLALAVAMMLTEGMAFVQAVYFAFIALTSIGYGDLFPATPAGKAILVVATIVSLGTVAQASINLAHGVTFHIVRLVSGEHQGGGNNGGEGDGAGGAAASGLLPDVIIPLALPVVYIVAGGAAFAAFGLSADLGEGLYMAGVTICTIGYGDYYPVAAPAQLAIIAYSVLGIGLVALAQDVVSSTVVERLLTTHRAAADRTGKGLWKKAISSVVMANYRNRKRHPPWKRVKNAQKMRSAFGGGVAATGTGASAGTTTGGASKETKAKRKDLMRGLVVGAFQSAKVDNAVAAAHKSADKSD